MSKYLKVQTELRDLDLFEAALEAVCAKRGIPFETHDKPEHLFGYHGDRREQTAHYIVRRQHIGSATNDLGFRREADGTISVVISEFDRGHSAGLDWSSTRGSNILNAVKQEYTLQKVKREASRRGLEVEEVEENGVIRLRLRQKNSRRPQRRVSVRR